MPHGVADAELDAPSSPQHQADPPDAPPETSLVNTRANEQYVSGLKCKRDHDYNGAYIHFSKAIFLLPDEPILYAARAECCIQMCDMTSAISNYKKALSLQGQPDPAHRQRLAALLDCTSVLYFITSRFDRALVQADLALQYSPQNKSLRLHRALALHMLHRNEEALHDATACEGTEQCQPYAWATKGIVLLSTNSFAKAKSEVEKCLLVAPDLPLVSSLEMLYDAMIGRLKDTAVSDMEQGRWTEAQRKLTICIEAFPHDPDLYIARSKCHVANEEYTASVQDLFESMNKSGMASATSSGLLADTLVRIASGLLSSGSCHQAITYADEALRWDGNCVHAYIVRGECHRVLGNHDASVGDFQQVLVIDPESPEGMERLSVAHCAHGAAFYQQGLYGKAENEFSRALSYAYDNPTFHLNRAKCLLMLQQPSVAVKELVICKRLNPTDPKILSTLKHMCPPDLYQALEVHLQGRQGGQGGLRQLGESGIYIAPSPPVKVQRRKPSTAATYTHKTRQGGLPQQSSAFPVASTWPPPDINVLSTKPLTSGERVISSAVPVSTGSQKPLMLKPSRASKKLLQACSLGRRVGGICELTRLRTEKESILTDPYGVTAVRGFVAHQAGSGSSLPGRCAPANTAGLWKGASGGRSSC